ncbi:unnamed protein product [Owenia fusiformis]|uniref:C-type lectin n=1 Tax=Owenia fusiformis TaxID=6347 RepID=A0A8S4PMZ0_OWEFU|nr:unnamed protein product [Owenia fusiformis]
MRLAIVLVLVLTIAIYYVECKKTAKRKAKNDQSVTTHRPKTTKDYETNGEPEETTKKRRKKNGKSPKDGKGPKDGKSPKGGKGGKGGKSTKTQSCHVMMDEYECKKQNYPCKVNPCLNGGTCEQVKYKSKGMKGIAKCICPEGYYGATCNKIKCSANCAKMGVICPGLVITAFLDTGNKRECASQYVQLKIVKSFTLSDDKKHCIRDCPEGTGMEGTNLYQHSDNCYKVYEQNATYAEAQGICEALGAGYHLTSVHDCDEHQFLDSVLAIRGIPNWWIGLARSDGEAGFTMWEDGSNVTYTYWVFEGPGDKNCVAIDHYKGYRFKTEDCDDVYSFVCKQGPPINPVDTEILNYFIYKSAK